MTKSILIVQSASEAENVTTVELEDVKTASIPASVKNAKALVCIRANFLNSVSSEFASTMAVNYTLDYFDYFDYGPPSDSLPDYHHAFVLPPTNNFDFVLPPTNNFDFELPIAEILESAANKIESFGWVKQWYGDVSNGYCVMGAIYSQIELPRNLPVIAISWLMRYLEVTSIPIWNDYQAVDSVEVVYALRKAAKEWRNNQTPQEGLL